MDAFPHCSTTCVSLEAKRTSDHLKLDLQMVVNRYVGVGIEPWSSGESVHALNH